MFLRFIFDYVLFGKNICRTFLVSNRSDITEIYDFVAEMELKLKYSY